MQKDKSMMKKGNTRRVLYAHGQTNDPLGHFQRRQQRTNGLLSLKAFHSGLLPRNPTTNPIDPVRTTPSNRFVDFFSPRSIAPSPAAP